MASVKSRIRTRDQRRPGAPAAPVSPASASSRVGIEIDGNVARVVTIDGRGHVEYSVAEGKTSADAIELALKGVRKSEIDRVAWSGGRQYVRQLMVPDVPSAAMNAAMQAVAEEQLPIVPGATAVAGLVLPPAVAQAAPGEQAMIVAAVESDDLDPVWRRLGGRRAPITASALLLPGDGCYVRIARCVAEVVLVQCGTPVAARVLQAGGVRELVRTVAGEGASLRDVMSVVTGAAPGDTGAIDGYLDALVAEVRRTIVFWRREGYVVPDDLMVIGEGAALPTLRNRLRDAGYATAPLPQFSGLDLRDVSELDQPAAYQAIAAAISDLSAQPFATLPNPVYVSTHERRINQSKRVRNFVVMLAVIAGLSALLAYPWFQAQAQRALAERDRDDKQEQLDGLKRYVALAEQSKAAKAMDDAAVGSQPEWRDAMLFVYQVKPAAIDPQNVQFANNAGDVVVTVTANVNDPQPLVVVSDWLTELEKQGATKVWSNQQSVDAQSGGGRAQMGFTIPRKRVSDQGTK